MSTHHPFSKEAITKSFNLLRANFRLSKRQQLATESGTAALRGCKVRKRPIKHPHLPTVQGTLLPGTTPEDLKELESLTAPLQSMSKHITSIWQTTPPPKDRPILIVATIALTGLETYSTRNEWAHDLYRGPAEWNAQDGCWEDDEGGPIPPEETDTLYIHTWADLPLSAVSPGEDIPSTHHRLIRAHITQP